MIGIFHPAITRIEVVGILEVFIAVFVHADQFAQLYIVLSANIKTMNMLLLNYIHCRRILVGITITARIVNII